ncbi:hypothetical protein [Bosea sp. (in: a-proteobacteria)]|uniref:hypothetical protein n=1 Tax=Bosea sp. (in: a-proteobacteria) TaxID=1871050 RepID=UPI00333F2BD8
MHGHSADRLRAATGGRAGLRLRRSQRPVERTTAMDIAMLALGLAFFAAGLAYIRACDAL